MDRPVGSGYFAFFLGVLFAIALICEIFVGVEWLTPQLILRVWFGFAALILIGWGITRIRTGDKKSLMVGQDTINWVVSILAATFVLMALLHDLWKVEK